MKRLAIAVCLCSAGALFDGPAHASGILVTRFGGEQGHPTTDDPTAIYYNPAGLSLKPGKLRVYLNGILVYRQIGYDRPVNAIDNPGTGTPSDATAANSGKASASNVAAIPFIAVASDLGIPHFGIGAAFFAPFGGAASFNSNSAFMGNTSYPGAVDGVQRWWVIDGTIQSLYGSLAASYTIPSLHLSIGAAGNVVISQISTLRARTSDGTDDLVDSQGGLKEGRSYLNVSGTSFSLGVGAILEPIVDKLWLGLSYQSQPGFGETTLTGTIENKFGLSSVKTSPVEVKQSMPDSIHFGARYRPMPTVELRLFGEYDRWSVFTDQCILDASVANRSCATKADGSAAGAGLLAYLPRNWHDTWAFRVGGSYFVKPSVELYLGAGYDGSAVPDATMDPSLFDMTKIDFSLGGRFKVGDKLALAVTYTQVIFLDHTVPVRGTSADVPPALAFPTRGPDGAGTYSSSVGLLNLGLEYRFM